MRDPQFLSWAAGYFEAEGHASIQKVKGSKNYHYPVVVHISNSDPEPVRLFYNNWGGGKWLESPTEYRTSNGEFKGGKTQFRVLYHWDTAGKVLSDILPYVKTERKRQQITLVLEAVRVQEEAASRGKAWGSSNTLSTLYDELRDSGYGRKTKG